MSKRLVKIPDELIIGFDLLVRLDKDQKMTLIELLSDYKGIVDFDEIKKVICAKISLQDDQGSEISKSILSFLDFLEYRIEDNDAGKIEMFVESIRENILADNKEQQLDFEVLKSLFQTLSNNSYLRLWAKAQQLKLDNENSFSNSRIITDIRPVFSVNALEADSFLLIHNLRIDYINSNRDIEAAIFALDINDLLELKKNIERAISKEAYLKEKIKSSMNLMGTK